ncbi:MAG: hypothetical protein JNK02_11670 [Planctomycetes bacterium]|nr:hypothetical protein [Planctomycetota bacterium]
MRCLAALLPLLLGTTLARPESGTFARPDPDPPALGEAPIVRVEHFVLEDEDGERHGFAVWRRRESARGVQFERELGFVAAERGAADSRVFHVECLERAGSRLVVRESGPRGRALLLELVGEGQPSLRALEWGPCASRREVLSLERTAALPLYLAELARTGRFTAGRVGLFDPSERAIVEVGATTTYATDGSGTRTCTWRRDDGTLVLELELRGTDLLGFRLQDGGPRARRVDAETWAALAGSTPTRVLAVR